MSFLQQLAPWGWGLVIVALLVILGLAIYAAALWRQVWRRRAVLREQVAAQLAARAADLRILAQALLDEQVPLIEGAIRIKVLLDNYDSSVGHDAQCQVFHQLFEATRHVPMHEAWKALSKLERRKHEARFGELELRHKAEARKGAQWLLAEGLPASA